MMHKDNFYSYLNIGLVCIHIVGFITLFSWAQLLFKIPLEFPIGLLAGIFLSLYFFYRNAVNLKKEIFIFLSLLSVSALLAGGITDFSWDGMEYHQEAVIQLANGWNPFWDEEVQDVIPWVNLFPKASWIFSAVVYKMTNFIELGKINQLLFFFSNIILVYLTTVLFLKSQKGAKAWTVIIVCNPVVIVQLFTYYVDGLLYMCILGLGALSYIVFGHRDKFVNRVSSLYIAMALLFMILCNLKYTGAVYAIIFAISLMMIVMVAKSLRQLLKEVAGVCLAGIMLGLIFGGHPYITNTIKYGHPFYPLMENNQTNIVAVDEHPDFLAQNRLTQLIWANLSTVRNHRFVRDEMEVRYGMPEIKIPFAVSGKELRCFFDSDTRIGGFGPWFNVILLISLFCIIYMIYRKDMDRNRGGLLLCLLIATLINPICWWARYAPYFYLLPVLACFFFFQAYRGRSIYVVVSIMLVNILFVTGANLSGQVRLEKKLYQGIQFVRHLHHETNQPIYIDFSPFRSARSKLIWNGIPYAEVDKEDMNPQFKRMKIKGLGEVFYEK